MAELPDNPSLSQTLAWLAWGEPLSVREIDDIIGTEDRDAELAKATKLLWLHAGDGKVHAMGRVAWRPRDPRYPLYGGYEPTRREPLSDLPATLFREDPPPVALWGFESISVAAGAAREHGRTWQWDDVQFRRHEIVRLGTVHHAIMHLLRDAPEDKAGHPHHPAYEDFRAEVDRIVREAGSLPPRPKLARHMLDRWAPSHDPMPDPRTIRRWMKPLYPKGE